MALDVKVRKIAGKISENRHFRRHHSHCHDLAQRSLKVIQS